MPLYPAMALEFAPPRRAALTTGLLMTSYHAGGIAATGLGLTPAPAAGWRRVFWAGVLPAVIAVPLLLKLLPESPGVLLAGRARDRARAVADRYGLPRPTVVAAPAAGAKRRLATVRALFHPDARWTTPLLWLWPDSWAPSRSPSYRWPGAPDGPPHLPGQRSRPQGFGVVA
ncbi:MFS transporter [Streptomyces massasporeus]|uniref:MFS transporter n=1 Tax=Streptomyces massasporeus TaxID=67324 RepID=A0ABW6LMF3_9ACTN